MRVGIVGLIEGGNLGDDLVFLGLLNAIAKVDRNAAITHLSFGENLELGPLAEDLSLSSLRLSRVEPASDVPLLRPAANRFADCDVVILGGGGLLQDTHHPLRPYHWLRYLPTGGNALLLAAGLGVGPLSRRWRQELTRAGSPFDEVWVRDKESKQLLSSLGWQSGLSTDFVTSDLVRVLVGGVPTRDSRRTLGVALRSWPGLRVAAVAAHLERVAAEHGVDDVTLFVLEAKGGQGIDVDFCAEVAEAMNARVSVRVYEPAAIRPFVDAMAACSVAVSMKLHGSILWNALGVPIYPIIYAPKVASYFGLSYSGLQVLSEPHRPPEPESGLTSASSIVGRYLSEMRTKAPSSGTPRSRVVIPPARAVINGLIVSVARRVQAARSRLERSAGVSCDARYEGRPSRGVGDG